MIVNLMAGVQILNNKLKTRPGVAMLRSGASGVRATPMKFIASIFLTLFCVSSYANDCRPPENHLEGTRS